MQSKLPITTADHASDSPVSTCLPPSQPLTARQQRSQGYWRSMNELDQTPEFRQYLEREFPQAASEFPSGVSRRRWLQLMSASIALSGAAGCRYGPERIAPFVIRPDNTLAGVPKLYATSFELAGRAVNLLVTNRDGRPIKVEGNPEHPLMRATEPNPIEGKPRFKSAGTDVFSQACVLSLYDDDRAHRVARRSAGELVDASWQEFTDYARSQWESHKASQGQSLAILMSPSLSPSVNRLVGQIAQALPKATIAQYKSIDDSAQRAAASQATGKPSELLLDLSGARVICCLDSDPLGNDPNMLVYSRQYSLGRTPDPATMNRLYSVEARYTVTGSSADSRLPIRSSQIGAFLVELDKAVDAQLSGQAPAAPASEQPLDQVPITEQLQRMIAAMAEDLVKHQGAGVVYVGAYQPLDVQLLALRLNQKLGNIGKTVKFIADRSAIVGVTPIGLDDLVEKLGRSVSSVWILGDNPVYTAPAHVGLDKALAEMEHVVYLADYEDETAKVSSWSLPLAHPLESWGDVLSVDGAYGVCQPQILPLMEGKSTVELLSLLMGQPAEGNGLVRATADQFAGSPLSASAWHSVLHDGYLKGSALELSGDSFGGPLPTGELDLEKIENGSLELILCESDSLYDGRFAKNVWLQELPQAITKLVWDNAALVSPKMAKKFGLDQSDKTPTEIVRIKVDGQQLELPVFIMPGLADGVIVTQLGYGRVCRDEAVSSDRQVQIGQDVSKVRRLDKMHIVTGVEVSDTSKPYKLATTQDHFAIDSIGRDGIAERIGWLVREGTLEQITEGGKDFVEHEGVHHPPLKSLWEQEPMEKYSQDPTVPYQWGMTIDLNKCTGCSSCVIACQAENNVPVVGKEQVLRGREMHWLRIDRYFRGTETSPQMIQQPVACAHCETAPCEQVCPVAATVHTEEGINAMAYNRCVGTRYCANNCPYKVRRFNYFNYQTEYGYFYGWQQQGKLEEASRKLQQLVLNPEVSVRGRGVMEKCTYCIQRVQNVKIQARTEGRSIEDGELQTACQTACPTQAIVFGNIKDADSQVSKNYNDPRTYAMLSELNIKPRTQYMARVRNTHPRLKASYQLKEAHHGDHGHGAHDHAGDHGDHQQDHDH
ncbi:MAG: TAT-variant-translocated molybdopterin oxidoreductase [Pirellulaceae bacterium]|nr:TAT-variant-translocated molybdopterin oxidoreductase [Pirellulaceae bacterium]